MQASDGTLTGHAYAREPLVVAGHAVIAEWSSFVLVRYLP